MGDRFTTSEKHKVARIVKGDGHRVTYVPPVALILALVALVAMLILAYVISGALMKLPAGLLLLPA